MDHSLIHHPEKWERKLAVLIAAITVIIVILNGYGLMFGITNVLPHLFYIPIILTAYFFPRRGTQFAVAVSAIYCGMTYVFNPIIPGDLLSAGGRVIIFILIAVVVSFLTTRLQASEEKYRLLADYTYDWEYWIGPDESIVYTTPSCERITGYTPAEFYTDPQLMRILIHPDDEAAHIHHMSHFFAQPKPESIDFRIVHRDGSVRWIGHICLPLYNAKGEFIGRRVSNRDITERKQVEEAYRETSRRLAEMIDFLPDATMIIDRSGVVVSWNRAMEQMSGLPASAILGRGKPSYTTWISNHTGPILIDYVLRGDTEGIKAAYSNVHFDGNTVRTEADITHVNGTRLSLWISATPLIDESGEVRGAIESVRDVSDIKRIQRALRESNAYLDTVINTLADPLFIKDHSHCFVKLNNAFCHFSGHAREDLMGKSDYDFFKKKR